MRCDFCSKSQSKRACEAQKRICNRFNLSDVFWCKRLKAWGRLLEYCNYKVLNEVDKCSEDCPQYMEMMKIAHANLHPFPYLKRLRERRRFFRSKKRIIRRKHEQNKICKRIGK